MKKVLVISPAPTKLIEELKNLGLVIGSETETKGIELVICRNGYPVTKTLIDKLPDLRMVLTLTIGFDHIDLPAAKDKGIIISNCPFANMVSTAEHSLTLMLAGMKNISHADSQLKQGVWDNEGNRGVELLGQRIGIVGLGKIGKTVARLFQALGARVEAFDPFLDDSRFEEVGINRSQTIEELFENNNFISVHVPKTTDSLGFIGLELLKRLKKPNGLVNTARGGVVSERDVLQALNDGTLNFYAADVFESEEENLNMDLLSHPKVIATPHIAANTYEAQEVKMVAESLEEIKRVLVDHQTPQHSVI